MRLSYGAPPLRDETLQNPRCVFQIVKRHFARYTPEMVEKTTGCPKETFLKVAETILANSGAERTTSFAYAVAWTQHTYGVQIIGACALLQLLLGNIGRPGAGVMALRGHASIQGSTDIPTLYHSIHGYMNAPSVLKKHETLQDFIATETIPTGLLREHAEVRWSPILNRCTARQRPRRTSSAMTGTRRFSATTRIWPCSSR